MNDETYYENQEIQQDESAYSNVQILDKRIEPDKNTLRPKVNRNIIMGNITKQQMQQYSSENRYNRMVTDVPIEYGGWFLHGFANMGVENVEFDVTLSRSVDGFNQKQLNTTNQNQNIKDEREKTGWTSMFRRKRRD